MWKFDTWFIIVFPAGVACYTIIVLHGYALSWTKHISEKSRNWFWLQLTQKNNKTKRLSGQCFWHTYPSVGRIKIPWQETKIGIRIPNFMWTFYRGSYARHIYLLMHGELDAGKDIGRFVMFRGRCTPILSETRRQVSMYLIHSIRLITTDASRSTKKYLYTFFLF